MTSFSKLLRLVGHDNDSLPVQLERPVPVILPEQFLNALRDLVRLEQSPHDRKPPSDRLLRTGKLDRDLDGLGPDAVEPRGVERLGSGFSAGERMPHWCGDGEGRVGALEVGEEAGSVPDGDAKDAAALEDAVVLYGKGSTNRSQWSASGLGVYDGAAD